MSFKKLSLFFVILALSVSASGKSFKLKELKQAKRPTYVLSSVADKMSYYDFVRKVLGPKMQEQGEKIQVERLDNERALYAGRGVSVKLNENNYNVHINFPNASTGGRSYGWTQGEVGDWSDAMYLDRLAEVVFKTTDQDMAAFYTTIIQMIGASRANLLKTLDVNTQTVATNFMAIYTAEAYRAMVPDAHMNWDDALLQVTLLGAFHGGQRKLTKFYVGEFSDESKKQDSGVYARGRPGPQFNEARGKGAEMRDYWQFSANVDSKQSGINITRSDFEKMGQVITRYERYVAKNPTLDDVFKVIGGDKRNVIKAISEFFTEGKSKDTTVIEELSQDIAKLMMDVHAHAEDITKRTLRNDRSLLEDEVQ